MRRLFVVLMFLLVVIRSHAQLSIGEFVKSVLDDPEVRTFNEQISYLQSKPYKLSYLQRMEFRTQNRELDPGQQEYALRFTPSNPWEVRNNSRYFQQYQSSLLFENEFLLKETLANRYYQVIEIMYLAEILRSKQQIIKSKADQLSILEQQMGSSFFDADEYVDLRIERIDQETDLEEIQSMLSDERFKVVKQYQAGYSKAIDWNFEKTLSVERMKAVVDSLKNLNAASRIIAYQKQKISLAQSEYNLEKSNVNLGFVQTEFDHRRVEQNRTPVNISLGFTIPIVNPNKGDMTKKKLEEMDAKFDLEEAQSEDKIDKQISQDRLENLFARYATLQQKINEISKSDISTTLQTLKRGDPIVKVKFEESVVRLNAVLGKIKRDIFIAYIDFLATSDFLQQIPLTNYFSPSLQKL